MAGHIRCSHMHWLWRRLRRLWERRSTSSTSAFSTTTNPASGGSGGAGGLPSRTGRVQRAAVQTGGPVPCPERLRSDHDDWQPAQRPCDEQSVAEISTNGIVGTGQRAVWVITQPCLSRAEIRRPSHDCLLQLDVEAHLLARLGKPVPPVTPPQRSRRRAGPISTQDASPGTVWKVSQGKRSPKGPVPKSATDRSPLSLSGVVGVLTRSLATGPASASRQCQGLRTVPALLLTLRRPAGRSRSVQAMGLGVRRRVPRGRRALPGQGDQIRTSPPAAPIVVPPPSDPAAMLGTGGQTPGQWVFPVNCGGPSITEIRWQLRSAGDEGPGRRCLRVNPAALAQQALSQA